MQKLVAVLAAVVAVGVCLECPQLKGTFRTVSPKGCRYYIECQDGKMTEKACSWFLKRFDPVSEQCQWCWKVNCSAVPTPWPTAPPTTEPPTTQPPTEPPTTQPPATTEEPKTRAPTTQPPATTEEPKTRAPTTQAPVTPTTEEPKTEAPTTEEPKTEAPTTEEPKTEAPSTEEPKTEAPKITENSKDSVATNINMQVRSSPPPMLTTTEKESISQKIGHFFKRIFG